MIDDVITLIGQVIVNYDEYGNEVAVKTETKVLCQARSISRNEFYSAASAGLKPEWTITLSNGIDYHGEKLARYHGDLYSIIRTYRDGDQIELTLERKVGNEERTESE